MLLKILSPKRLEKKLAFLIQNTSGLCKKWIGFQEKPFFLSPKIGKIANVMIKTSIPAAQKGFLFYTS
jgi:hypothetical protein